MTSQSITNYQNNVISNKLRINNILLNYFAILVWHKLTEAFLLGRQKLVRNE